MGSRGGSLLFRTGLSLRALLCTPEASCVPPSLADAVCCLRRDMSGSATSPFRLFVSRGCKVHAFALGPQACSPPADRTADVGLSTPRSDGGISPHARGLLRGATALTAAGLPPASPIRPEVPRACAREISSGRTMSKTLREAACATYAVLDSAARTVRTTAPVRASDFPRIPMPSILLAGYSGVRFRKRRTLLQSCSKRRAPRRRRSGRAAGR